MYSVSTNIKRIPVSILLVGILFSCTNNIEDIQRVTYDPNAPDEVMQKLDVYYTDSAQAQVRVQATIAETYSTPKQVTKFKDGLQVDFFEDNNEIGTTLTALYGEMDAESGDIFVRDSVRLYNHERKQLLETEELFYDQADSSVYTNKNVVITSPTETAYGKGVKTSRLFEQYEIKEPHGKVRR